MVLQKRITTCEQYCLGEISDWSCVDYVSFTFSCAGHVFKEVDYKILNIFLTATSWKTT